VLEGGDDGDSDRTPVCALAYTPPISLTLRGTAAKGLPEPKGLPDAQCFQSQQAHTLICNVGAMAGTYDFTIEAPGYEPHRVTTTVKSSSAPCSGGYEAQALVVVLTEAPSI
jgi:hypothetical protein